MIWGKVDCPKVDGILGRDDDSKVRKLLGSVVVVEPETKLFTGGISLDVPSPTPDEAGLDVKSVVVIWDPDGSKLNSEEVEKLVLNPEDWADENDAKLASYEKMAVELEIWTKDEGMIDEERNSEVDDEIWDCCPEDGRVWDKTPDSD